MAWKIYKHTSKTTSLSYIGQTCQDNVNRRWQNGKGYEGSPKFWPAIEVLGWDDFTHEIIESNITSQSLANEREQYWISFYNSYENGYNATVGGTFEEREVICIETGEIFFSLSLCARYYGIKTQNLSQNACKNHRTCKNLHFAYLSEYNEETWEAAPEYDTDRRRKASTLKKEVYCLQTNKFYSSATEAGEATGVEAQYVCKCCSGELIETHGHNYCWKEEWYEGWQPRKSKAGQHEITDEIKLHMSQAKREAFYIEIMCIETKKVYTSYAEAEEKTGIDGTTISRCCNKVPHYNTAGGYHWCYLSELDTFVIPKNKKAKAVRNVETGEVFPSITEAKKVYGGDISGAVRKGHKAGGYHWEYAE